MPPVAGNGGRDLVLRALDTLGVGICVLDGELRPVFANPAMENLTGYRLHDLRQAENPRRLLRGLIREHAGLATRVRDEVLRRHGRLSASNVVLSRPDDRRVVCNLALDPIPGDGERPDGLVCTAVDVTEQDALQQQVLASQKMEAIGRMAGGIAHDFNNILGGVLGYASLLRQKLDDGGPLLGYVSAIEDSAWRASELTHQLLAFAREDHLRVQPADLNELVRDAVRLVEHSLTPDIVIRPTLAAERLTIDADPARIRQALVNLLINARDAIAGSGEIRVRSDIARFEVDDPLGRGTMIEPYCRVVVEDTGRGMPGHVYQRIFEPFFSTKEDVERFGLGLSVVYGVVKAHGGHVRVDSEPGAGTAVTVCLPPSRSREDTAGPPLPRKPGALARGTETVLVVDDEHLIRTLARDVLGACGYEVLLAADGSEALALINDRGDDIALVLMDLVMPGMSGVDTLDAIRATHPEVRCVFSSGYGSDGLADAYGGDPRVRILPKPFDARSLCSSVRNLLDANE